MKLRDRVVEMDPRKISPFHEEVDPKHTAKISSSMAKHGWQGRPLVVMELPDGTLKGITGSHRVRAAVAAGLNLIPVIQLGEEERDAVVEQLPWFEEDHQALFSRGPEGDVPFTRDVADIIFDLGDNALGELLSIEDLGFQKFTKKQIERLLNKGYSEEVVELL